MYKKGTSIGQYYQLRAMDILADSQLTCRPRVSRVLVDMIFKLVDHRLTLSVLGRYVGQNSANNSAITSINSQLYIVRLSVVYQSTVGDI